MQMKVGLAVVLRKYKVKLEKKINYPLELDPKSLMLASKEHVLLSLEKIQQS